MRAIRESVVHRDRTRFSRLTRAEVKQVREVSESNPDSTGAELFLLHTGKRYCFLM